MARAPQPRHAAHHPPGLAALALSGTAPSPLLTLSLRDCGFTTAGVTTFCARAQLPRLHTLALSGAALDASAIRALGDAPLARGLQRLSLRACGLSVAAVAALARAPALCSLQDLDLRDNELGEDSLLELARSPHLAGVRRVRLGGTCSPWQFDPASRDLLDQRFGPYWYGSSAED